MGLGGMMGLYFLPSIYTYTMETSKTFAPSNIKGYFYDRNYLERVAKLKQHVREQRKKGNRMLSYDDKLMIYSEFLEMIQPKMNEFYEERDLGLKNSIQNMTPDEFISEFKKFDYREQSITKNLFKHFMLDIGINSQNQLIFLKDIDMEFEFQAQFSKLVVEAYRDKIIPVNCIPRNVRKLKKIIDSSMSYGRKNMFKDIKDEGQRERLLQNYFEYKSFVDEGILFTSCFHLINLKTYFNNVKKMNFADTKLDQKFEEFMLSDRDRRRMRRAKGKHFDSHNKTVRVDLDTTLAESQEKQDRIKKRIQHNRRKKQQSKEEFERIQLNKIKRAKDMDEKFNNDFFESEYEYSSHQMAPHKRTTVDLSFDKEGNKLTEEEKMQKMFEHSRNSQRQLSEETFGTEGGTTGWEGASEQKSDRDGFGDHEMDQKEEKPSGGFGGFGGWGRNNNSNGGGSGFGGRGSFGNNNKRNSWN